MSNDPSAKARIDEFLANPDGKIAFVAASEDPDAAKPEFFLIVSGRDIVGKLTFDEARSVADFFYGVIPPRQNVQ
jgi:hypothetical protein